MAKRDIRNFLMVKVDYEKAFDSLNCNYLRFLLNRMRFGEKWKYWMEACIFNNSTSVTVNGNAIKDFKLERGLRKGILYPHFCLF